MQSFENVQGWKEVFEENCNVRGRESFPFVVVGNKADLVEGRQESEQEGRQWEKVRDVCYFETSAKEAVGVEKAFQGVARAALKAASLDPQLVPQSVTLAKKLPKADKKKCAC